MVGTYFRANLFPILYNMIWLMMPSGSRTICMIEDNISELDLYYTDPAQHLTTARQDLDDLDHDLENDLSEVCIVWKSTGSILGGP